MNGRPDYADRNWTPQPRAAAAMQAYVDAIVAASPGARAFADRLFETCAIRLRDIVDYVEADAEAAAAFAEAGWSPGPLGALENPRGLFAPVATTGRRRVWLRCESLEAFARVAELDQIEGRVHGGLRRARAFTGPMGDVGVVERNGAPGFDIPVESDHNITRVLRWRQALTARRREFDTVEAGLDATEALVGLVVDELGPHRACSLWLSAERAYWLRRCAAGREWTQRQNAAGVGWANVDHHTYDSSRRHFRRTIAILERLGYELREMLYAGELAGWGSQVLEQPVIGSTIFADVDLAPHELTVDFAHEELPDLPKHRRAGLLSALLGESILEAGLNHVAGLYDQVQFRRLANAASIGMMAPFTSFPHLYQELSEGDWDAVDPFKVDALEAAGHIAASEADRLRREGSIFTHLENIERNDGFKGFNREGIDQVLRKLDPRAYLSSNAPSIG